TRNHCTERRALERKMLDGETNEQVACHGVTALHKPPTARSYQALIAVASIHRLEIQAWRLRPAGGAPKSRIMGVRGWLSASSCSVRDGSQPPTRWTSFCC